MEDSVSAWQFGSRGKRGIVKEAEPSSSIVSLPHICLYTCRHMWAVRVITLRQLNTVSPLNNVLVDGVPLSHDSRYNMAIRWILDISSQGGECSMPDGIFKVDIII